ncbi:uncharacterized protein LOC132741255 [Ruditapes philippinarum]|uniref:uncharacterized protein LOC132741255 n=1 Tax=Ruditapes philippinarum TaxID=129788 RepID=UPI00295AF4B8|nr:uncharacterized protein LOC132741255 [Ruditapes philippinarum]
MVNYCRVNGCHNRSNRESQLSYYRLSEVIVNQGETTQKYAEERRMVLLAKLDQDFSGKNLKNIRVCSAHFLSGKRADLYDRDNRDWAPTVNMGSKPAAMKDRYERRIMIENYSFTSDAACNQQMTAQIPAMIPQFLPLTQAAGQQVVLDMSGTNPHESILLTMAQLLVQGTKLPQSATMPGTSLKSDFRGGNQLDKINSTDGIKSENVSKEEKKADIVFTLGSSTLSAEEQLKKFVSSSQASRNQAYYVVVNKGEKNERAFLIEPNKKGKSKPNTKRKIKTEKNDDSLVKTLDTVKTEPDKKPVKVEQEVVVPDSSTGDPEPQNKFLKFCQLPKTPAKVPVAAVTPQRQSEQEIKTETADSVKEEPSCSFTQTMSNTSQNPLTTSTIRQLQPTCTSPVLFEDGQTDVPAPDCVNKTNNLADLDKEHSTKKKPIFKKRNSLSTKTLKSEIEYCKGTSKDGDSNIDGEININEVNDDKDNADDFKEESKGGGRIKSTTRGKVDMSVVDKVKQGRKKSGDVLQETKDKKNVVEELLDGESASGNNVNSDEEFLNTRRRGGRKRKSTSKFQEWSKRSRKGVTYDDNENTDEKENKARNQCLSCIKCGKQLLPLGQYEKQKKHPEFLSCVFKKNTELIYFPNMKTKDCQLQTVESETNNKGLLLNSVYDETLGCCIQYLQCRQCKNDTVIGARVLLADSTSQYTTGQTWILSSAAKL